MSSPIEARHPRGLATLFFTEMWERFTFYGMRSLLVLYMTAAVASGGLGIEEKDAVAIYGLYLGCVYLFSLPGGWIADRLIGQQRAVMAGAVLIAAGNIVLGLQQQTMFFIGLIIIVLGVGLLKPNISAMVGQLYTDRPSAQRDAGFLIFYMGINVGGVLAPLLVGTVGEKFSWSAGFVLAGLLMLLGLAQFVLQRQHLLGAGAEPAPATPAERRNGWLYLAIGMAILLALVGLAFAGVIPADPTSLAEKTGMFMVVLAVGFFGYVFAFGKLTAEETKRVAVIVVLFLSAATFFMGFELAGSTFNLFARDYTDRTALGGFFPDGLHPASWYQSLNPLYVILFAPMFGALWVNLARRNLEPSIPLKFALGLIQMGLGFVIIAYAAWLVLQGGEGTKVLPVWLLLTYLLHTFAELCLSPIGLSAITKLAPARFVSQMMGSWFAGTALGNLLSGLIAGHLGSEDITHAPMRFMLIFGFATAMGVLLLVLTPTIKRLMGGVR